MTCPRMGNGKPVTIEMKERRRYYPSHVNKLIS